VQCAPQTQFDDARIAAARVRVGGRDDRQVDVQYRDVGSGPVPGACDDRDAAPVAQPCVREAAQQVILTFEIVVGVREKRDMTQA
jgi:hypothetical protein